jgi:predicted kinase
VSRVAGSAERNAGRSIIMVSGAPACGKSTLASSLAQILEFPLITKDTIKESLFDSLGSHLSGNVSSAAELSSLLSRAAIDLLWSLAPYCTEVILEANFRPKDPRERERFTALEGRKLEVYCHCSPEESARRFRERAIKARHHPAHSMKTLSAELLEEFDRPVGLSPVIDIDTESPVNPLDVIERIRAHWPDLSE